MRNNNSIGARGLVASRSFATAEGFASARKLVAVRGFCEAGGLARLSRQVLSASFLLCFFFFVSCASLSRPELSPEEEAALFPPSSYIPESFEWEEVCPGLSRFDFENPDFPLIYHAVKIDLNLAGPDGPLCLISTTWEGVRDFAERQQCVVAVNATPFTKKSLVGVHKEGGLVLSQPVERYAALGFCTGGGKALELGEAGEDVQSLELGEAGGDGKSLELCEAGEGSQSLELGGAGGDGQSGELSHSQKSFSLCAAVFPSQLEELFSAYDYVFGGFFTVLEDGEVRQDFIHRHDSRSGAGLSSDGKTLYLLVCEGEEPSESIGLSYPQCGELFKAMGCSDALEFDGGGSAELCINGKSVLSYKVGRVQANSFGFKVK